MHLSLDVDADAALLDILTGPDHKAIGSRNFVRRDAALDPLLIAAAAASGPHVTRNHYAHDFFPGVMLPQEEGGIDWTKFKGDDRSHKRLAYVSRQAPRRQRLSKSEIEKENEPSPDNLPQGLETAQLRSRRPSSTKAQFKDCIEENPPAVHVKCMARTRIPTPHGPVFLHLYHNNRDDKEHLAIVVDSAQSSDPTSIPSLPYIRSRSLDSVWDDSETEMDRIIRGAYVGRLSSTFQRAANANIPPCPHAQSEGVPPPLIRIHSECFTGETVGSMRCDCGEQLDEAIRQLSLPIKLPNGTTIPGRGAVIYMRQEGRGIGLLSKIRAYNLQDMGHDTVTANIMLGHKADERGYEVAGAILRDLGMGSDSMEGVRVLTNNPDKVQALEKEGIKVVERVPMVPRSWQQRKAAEMRTSKEPKTEVVEGEVARIAGATLVGGGAVYGEDLDKYLRTKVIRMGHMLPLWLEEPDTRIY